MDGGLVVHPLGWGGAIGAGSKPSRGVGSPLTSHRDDVRFLVLPPPTGIITLGAGARDALEGKGPQRRPQRRLDRRLEEVAEVVAGGYCRLHMPWKLAFAVRKTVAGHRLGALV